jgi:two-component system, NtrC family, response regulator AtoC
VQRQLPDGGKIVQTRTIFVVDDNQDIRDVLFNILSRRGYEVHCFDGGEALFLRLSSRANDPGLILLDVMMPECDGFEVIQKVRASGFDVPIVMLSALSDLRTVVSCMKLGALNFVPKPFDEEVLVGVIEDVFERATATMSSTDKELESAYGKEFLTSNSKMLRTVDLVGRVAKTDVPILILGESGVGKEVMARFAHRTSGRADKPFVKINCAALPHELLESELFGYEKGAFTGAFDAKTGKFEQADGGTLLLDEIGEMSAHLQSKLLHVLQDGTFSKLGGRKTVRVDVRIIAATNIKLEEAVACGKFREDLYYRLNVVRIDLPPLRDRLEDIPRLCTHFVEMYAEKYHSPVDAIPPALLLSFAAYNWPGNIRQLENIVRRFLLLQNAQEIANELRSKDSFSPTPDQPVTKSESLLSIGAAAADYAERHLVEKVLAETGGNRKKAAQRLNISYKALLNKLKRWSEATPVAIAASATGEAAAAEAEYSGS